MARTQYFYNVMRKTTVQFLQMFQDINIARYNPDTGMVIKYVRVPLRFAPKTKQWYWQELKDNADRRDSIFPTMAVNLESVDYASDRQVNRNAKVTFFNDGTLAKQHYNPVPYDYTFSLKIAAEHMVDITQIVEQILPFFTPEAYVRITIPELRIEGLAEDGEAGSDKLDLKVLYEGSSKEAPIELDEAGFRVLEWTLTFKVQGYLFSPIYEVKAIHKVVQNYYDSLDTSISNLDDVTGVLSNQILQGVTEATSIPVSNGVTDVSMYEFVEGQVSSGYTSGTVTTTGGSGSGLTLTITVNGTGGIVTVVVLDGGSDYQVGDQVLINGGDDNAMVIVNAVETTQADDSIRNLYTYEHYIRSE